MPCNIADIESISTSSSKSNVSIEQQVPPTCSTHVSPPDNILQNYVKDLVTTVAAIGPALTKEKIDKINTKIRTKYRIMPSKHDIRRIYEAHHQSTPTQALFLKWLVKRASRADSGVLVATITLSPHKFSCKYDCFYCPQETDLNGVPTQPRSYLSTEPAMLRAIGTRTSADTYDFDVLGQFQNRIQAYLHNGAIKSNSTKPKKMEIILSGGTWHSYPKEYRYQVATEVYYAANTMTKKRPIKSLKEEIEENMTAEYRIIGLTCETRPDNITEKHILEALEMGFTRMQLGEQTDDDAILKLVNRKCYLKDTINAHRLLKQAGFKIVAHLMPDLPGSSPARDRAMFQNYLTNPDLQIDDLKVYPTAVVQSASPDRIVTSKIADWYKSGKWTPYAEKNIDDLVDVLIEFKTQVHPWWRLERIVRDIPSQSIAAGYNKMSNLRQIIQAKMKKHGLHCHCIYCMEIGDKELDPNLTPITVVRPYAASGGTEYFISVEAHTMTPYQKFKYNCSSAIACVKWLITGKTYYWAGDKTSYAGLYGFCRLRDDPSPGGTYIPEINNCALIREVHVYGFSMGVGTDAIGSQHRGHGQHLVATAEQIAAQIGYKKTAVIAGVGTREYYKNKCGYHLGTYYMLKDITAHFPYHSAILAAAAVGIMCAAAFRRR
jgi:ELP3 family radical SAM enzyme/protein acetyltransferase